VTLKIMVRSPESIKALKELQEETDAATPEQVVRNALRLHLAVLRAHKAGVNLYVRKGSRFERAIMFEDE